MSTTEPENKKSHMIGYARVSTEDQNLALQMDALLAAGVDPRDIYQEKTSSWSKKRPEFDAMWKDLREGDTLVVWKIDRIHREARKFWIMVEELRQRGCSLVVLTQPGLDVRTPEGALVFGVLASVAEYERALTIFRTKAGLDAARARGRVGGRKRILTDAETLKAWDRFQAGEALKDIAAAHVPKVTAQAYSNRFTAMGLK